MQQEYWDRFKEVHTESTVKFVESILGKTLSQEDFMAAVSKACPGKKNRHKNSLFRFLVKYNWITGV